MFSIFILIENDQVTFLDQFLNFGNIKALKFILCFYISKFSPLNFILTLKPPFHEEHGSTYVL